MRSWRKNECLFLRTSVLLPVSRTRRLWSPLREDRPLQSISVYGFRRLGIKRKRDGNGTRNARDVRKTMRGHGRRIRLGYCCYILKPKRREVRRSPFYFAGRYYLRSVVIYLLRTSRRVQRSRIADDVSPAAKTTGLRKQINSSGWSRFGRGWGARGAGTPGSRK